MSPQKRSEPGIERPVIHMDPEDLKAIIADTIRHELEAVGLFPEKPEERQKLQSDFQWVRRMRQSWDNAAATIGKAVLTFITLGTLGAIAAGIKAGWFDPPSK